MQAFAYLLPSLLALPLLAPPAPGEGPAWTDLLPGKDLSAFRGKTDGWAHVESVALDPKLPRKLIGKPGVGAVFNGAKGRARDLVTTQTYGDLEVHVEFLIAKGSNSGVKFQGLYEIQIVDSHKAKVLTGDSCGGIYPRAELKPKYHHIDKGIAPRTNAARPAGEWQTLDAIFLAPRFDAAGKKVANARIVRATLNGKLIHENVELKTPTGANWTKKEVARGPLLLQGDHGPVAFRNVRVRPYRGKTTR
jgi:hypothetical protein